MTAAITEIPSRLRNVSSNDPFVAGADDIDFNKPASTGTTGDYPYNGLGRIVLKKKYSENIDYANQPILEQADFDDDNNNHLTNTVFVIKYDFVLTEDITLGSGCVLEFEGGSISGNYTVTLQNTLIHGSNKSICCTISGTFGNDVVYSGWFENNEDFLLNAISSCCINSRVFIFENGNYTFTKDICIYNNTSVFGQNATIIFDFDATGKTGVDTMLSGIICGAEYRKAPVEDAKKWSGEVAGLSIKCINNGQDNLIIDSLINLLSVHDCKVHDCILDISESGITGANALICKKNNAEIGFPIDSGENIMIYNNTIISDDTSYSRSTAGVSVECIGIANNAKHVFISNNRCLRSSDDLGIHECDDVEISNNFILANSARIYCSGSTNLNIHDNTIVSARNSTMGIVIDREGSSIQAKNITITNNHIKIQDSGTLTYGIRIHYGYNVVMQNNDLPDGGIVVEQYAPAITSDPLTLEERTANEVKVDNNITRYIRILANPNNPIFFVKDNYIETSVWIVPDCLYSNNKYGDSTQLNEVILNATVYKNNANGYIDFNIDPSTHQFSSAYETVDMKLNSGDVSVTIPFRCIVTYIVLSHIGNVYSDGYDLLDIYKNGNLLYEGGAISGINDVTDSAGACLEANSVITAKIRLNSSDTYNGPIFCRMAIMNLDDPNMKFESKEYIKYINNNIIKDIY